MSKFNNLNSMFESQKEFETHFNNLRQVRDGLYQIITDRPDLSKVVGNQFHTLNDIIDALIKDTGYCHQTNEYINHFKN